ncbi:MAG: alkaline phosphatase [Pseudomonadales bacterium]|nr:alkaline phosphatase [Pseudomonadales bacterium]
MLSLLAGIGCVLTGAMGCAHDSGILNASGPVSTPVSVLDLMQEHRLYQNVKTDLSYATAQTRVSQRKRAGDSAARNVIFFVGDGMGVSTVTAARIYAGQLRGEPGEENYLSFEEFPNVALSKTYNTDAQVPDSAGTMTAMMSGVKTRHGVLGVSRKAIRSECDTMSGAAVPSFLELMEVAGKATGIISTAEITHATPGATYSHSVDRNWASDADMPDAALKAGCVDIAQQLIDFSDGDGIDIVLGGGRRSFLPVNVVDFELGDKQGKRLDGKNLIDVWKSKHKEGQFVWNAQQFNNVKSLPLLGLFEYGHMKFSADRSRDPAGEPSLSEMTEKSINLLQQASELTGQGFFLMVEAGRIDHAHHGANAYRALSDALALSDAVSTADRLTSDADTLIIVTADHSHTMSINGYPARGNPILGKVRDGNGDLVLDNNKKPYTTLSYANGPGHNGQDLREIDTRKPNYLQEGMVPLYSETHGGEDVAVYAKGPSANLVGGVMEQNEIFHVMLSAVKGSTTD